MKSVSIIIPTFNRAHFIVEAINSVVNQDTKNCKMDIIVVDDGSTDNTREVVVSYGKKIKYIFQENQGAGVARNRGIKEALGEWVAFLDSDDRWLPDKLSLQFKVLEAFPEYKAIHSNFYTFYGDRIVISNGLEYWVTATKGGANVNWSDLYSRQYKSSDFGITRSGTSCDIYSGNLFGVLLKAPCAACWTLLIRRDCLGEDIRFAENYPTWEDYWFFCRLSESHDVLFIDCPTAENRGHTGPRLTQTQKARTLECYLDMCERIYFPSTSPHRPLDEAITKHYRNASTALFKEYLKNGELLKARAFAKSVKGSHGFEEDLTIPLYRVAALLPFDMTNRLVKLKRTIFGE